MKNFWQENRFFVLGVVIGWVISFFLLTYLNSISETAPLVESVIIVVLTAALVFLLRLNEVSWKNIALGSLTFLLLAVLVGLVTFWAGAGVFGLLLRTVLNFFLMIFVYVKFFHN